MPSRFARIVNDLVRYTRERIDRIDPVTRFLREKLRRKVKTRPVTTRYSPALNEAAADQICTVRNVIHDRKQT